jgi:hypothetical protein
MQDILNQSQMDISKPYRFISQMLANTRKQERVYTIKPKNSNNVQNLTRRDILKLVKEDTNLVFYLDEEFIVGNEEILLKIVANSSINLEQKREMLRHLDNICEKRQHSMLY